MMSRMFVQQDTKESRQLLADMTTMYRFMKVFTETPRKPRAIINVKNLTGSEFGVLTFSVFPAMFRSMNRNEAEWYVNLGFRSCLELFAVT